MPILQRRGIKFQLTAARRRLAAGVRIIFPHRRFNSQPREGGWNPRRHAGKRYRRFNSQPREGGWLDNFINTPMRGAISTHSRAKAAGTIPMRVEIAERISTHSRAKAAGQTTFKEYE